MPKSFIRVAPFRRILSVAEPEVLVQLVRLAVLYEDLKVEFFNFDLPYDKTRDDVGQNYRQMYTIRRAFATIWEMDNAIHRLNSLPEFKPVKRSWKRERLRVWTSAVRFFSKAHNFIDQQRNAYGGHFTDGAARFVLGRLKKGDNSVGSLEIKISDDRTFRYAFKFAESLVSQALFIGRFGEERDELEAQFQESMNILTGAVRHATNATQILGDFYFLPAFGWKERA